MSEWINATPILLEREAREVDGVIETYLTPEAEVLHRQHLEQDKQRRIRAYAAEVLKLTQPQEVIEQDEYRFAAD